MRETSVIRKYQNWCLPLQESLGPISYPTLLPGAESDYNTEDDFEGEEEAALEDDPCVVEARVFTWEGS